jgi:hypothetical protein
MWEPQPLAALRASMACTGITLPFTLYDDKHFNKKIYGLNTDLQKYFVFS